LPFFLIQKSGNLEIGFNSYHPVVRSCLQANALYPSAFSIISHHAVVVGKRRLYPRAFTFPISSFTMNPVSASAVVAGGPEIAQENMSAINRILAITKAQTKRPAAALTEAPASIASSSASSSAAPSFAAAPVQSAYAALHAGPVQAAMLHNAQPAKRQKTAAPKKVAKKDLPHVLLWLLWLCHHGAGQNGKWTNKNLKVVGVYAGKAAAEAKKYHIMSTHECCGHGDILVGGSWDDEIDLVVRPCEEVALEGFA
jgi:hypothetical protein